MPLASVIDLLLDAICIVDAEGHFVFVSAACERIFGYTQEEMIGRQMLDLVAPEDRERTIQASQEIMSGQPKLNFENRYIRKDGQVVHIRWSARWSEADQLRIAVAHDITERMLNEEKILLQDDLLKEMSRMAKVGAWSFDPDTGEGQWTDEVARILEVDPAAATSLAYGLSFYQGENRAIIQNAVDAAISRGTPFDLELELVTASGRPLWGRAICRPLVTNGKVVKVRGTFQDVTERRTLEESMRMADSLYKASSEAMLIADADNRIMAVNPAFTTITGYGLDEVVGKDPSILSSGRHDAAFYRAMWESLNSTGYWQGEVWDKRKNGEIYPKWLTINTIFNNDGTVQRRVAMFTDITERRASEKLIWRQANFDSLTGLPNRQMFLNRLEQEIKKTHRSGRALVLMFIDIDQFKEVNDTLGHDMGDVLLQELAARLSGCVRETDHVARLGGDEFTIILSDLESPDSVDRVAQNILLKMAEPLRLGEDMAYVSASIGVTFCPQDATDIETLLKNADQAMYASKSQGRNRYSYFTPSMQQATQTRMRIANDLRQALAGNQFRLYYQPIVELATNAIHKAEALIRWQHPRHGEISPAEFIPIAEDIGLIVDIGEWVFREAASQVSRWRAAYHGEFQISVNKSPAQFRDNAADYAAWPEQLQQLGLPGQSIVVEITEGMLMDASDAINRKLLSYRDAGIQVSLDDFGTGYSSLSYLKKFDIDYLKIDQSFIRNLAPGSDDMALCEAIIVMAHKLNMKVIAEGVETAEQRNLLLAAGCDYGQGYLFSKAVPADAFEALLDHARS